MSFDAFQEILANYIIAIASQIEIETMDSLIFLENPQLFSVPVDGRGDFKISQHV